MPAISALTCDNESGPDGATNTRRDLTTKANLMEAGAPMADAQPTQQQCLKTECPGYRGRLVRGMCDRHYKAWTATTPKEQRPKTRFVKTGCSVTGCDVQLIQARGWCAKHYSRWKNHGDPQWEPPAPQEGCKEDGCSRSHEARGWCFVHYQRWAKHGDPNLGALNRRDPICDLPDCDKPSPGAAYCPMHFERLRRNGHFDRQVRTRHLHDMGYVLVKVGDHPVAQKAGWAYEHRVVLFDKIGPGWHSCHWCGTTVTWDRTYPLHADGLVVDHVDERRDNNDPDNLVPSCSVCNFQRSSRWVRQRGAS